MSTNCLRSIRLRPKHRRVVAVLPPTGNNNPSCRRHAACQRIFEEEELNWGKLVHACTDEAPAMMGARSGFAKLLKQKNPKFVTQHCIIHREALASRTMTQPLKETMETVVRLVYFVKASALSCRLFRRLCQDMESDYEGLLFHTAVRWLSKDVHCAFALRKEQK